MDREISFYYLITGLIIQFLVMIYYYALVLPPTLAGTLAEGELPLFMFMMLLASPIAAIFIQLGNKNSKVFPIVWLNMALFIPVPVTILGAAFL